MLNYHQLPGYSAAPKRVDRSRRPSGRSFGLDALNKSDAPWFDDAIDCVADESLFTEWKDDGQRLISAITKFFAREFPGVDEGMIAGTLHAKSAGGSPDELFALRDLPVRELVSAIYGQHLKAVPVKALGDKFLRMFDLHYARYEYARLLEHGVAPAGQGLGGKSPPTCST